MTTTPIFDALYREHRNAGMAYPGAPDLTGDENRTWSAAPQRARTRARRTATVGGDQEPSPDGERDGPRTARCSRRAPGMPPWRPGPTAIPHQQRESWQLRHAEPLTPPVR